MDYEQIAELEKYVKQAEAARDAWNRERDEAERTSAERHAQEQRERLEIVKAHLQEIVPPALWPLMFLDEERDIHTGTWRLPFLYDDREIMRLVFYVNANMAVDGKQIEVPDARFGEGCDEDGLRVYYADMVYNHALSCIERTDGAAYAVDEWQFATARAFGVLRAFRDYEQRAAAHNAELAERAKEDEIVAQVFGKAEAETPEPDAYILLELSDPRQFEREVNQHLEAGYMLQGPPCVVMHDDPNYSGRRIPVYYQALILPEPF